MEENSSNKKIFTYKQVAILILAIVAGFAFLQTSSPIWTLTFWRQFGLYFITGSAVAEVIVLILVTFQKEK